MTHILPANASHYIWPYGVIAAAVLVAIVIFNAPRSVNGSPFRHFVPRFFRRFPGGKDAVPVGSVKPVVMGAASSSAPAGPPPDAAPTPFLVEQAEARKTREAAEKEAAELAASLASSAASEEQKIVVTGDPASGVSVIPLQPEPETTEKETDQEPSVPAKAPIVVAHAPGTMSTHGTLGHNAKTPDPGTVFTPKT